MVLGSYKDAEPPVIEGSGYVVKTLEAALWAFFKTEDFKSGCLKVANLGGDADTTAAVYGQIAGAFYGVGGIDGSWREKIALSPYINSLADEIIRLSNAQLFPDEPLTKNQIVDLSALSAEFSACKQCFDIMETEFLLLRAKLTPGPKAYASLAAFDEDFAKFEQLYSSTAPECPQKSLLWADMKNRVMMSYRDKLGLRLARPKLVLPFGKK